MTRKIKFKIFLLITLILLLANSLGGLMFASPVQASGTGATAPIKFKHLTTADGLPSDVVYSILQDRQGFMWFSGEGGLARYDGYSFKVYQNDPLNPTTIASNNISQIYEDQDGAIWCSTWGAGVDRFDPQTETFQHYKNDPVNANSLSDDRVHVIYQDKSGVMWFGTFAGGLNRFDPQFQTFTRFQQDDNDPNSLSNNRVWSVVEDEAGNLWVGTDNGLNKLDRATGKFTHYRNDPNNPRSLSNNESRWLYVDHTGTMWVSTAGGLNRYDPVNQDFTRYIHDPQNTDSLSNDIAYKIREDAYQRLWIGTKGIDSGGLNLFDPKSQKFASFSHDPNNPDSISHNDIRDVFIDRSGVLWIGTRGGGVNKLDLKPQKFQRVTRNPNQANTLHGTLVFSLAEDPAGNLWVGTDGGGLNRYSTTRGLFSYYTTKNSPISNDSILALQVDRAGLIWLGTKGGGLNCFDPQTGQFTVYKNDPKRPQSLSNDQVYSLLQDREGHLWIGTDKGLNLWHPEDQTFSRFQKDPQDPNSLSHNSVLSLMQARDGSLWIGTWGGGLNKLVFSSSGAPQFTLYRRELNNPTSLSNNEVTALLEDSKGNVWIGTNGGLNQLDPQTGNITTYFKEQGLPSSEIAGLLEDPSGAIWISTIAGLSSFDPVNKTFHNYDIADGLQNNQFKDGAAFRSSSGQFYFGGIDGFTYFDPSNIQNNLVPPPVVLTSFKLFEKPVTFPQSISYLQQIELENADKFFSFEFAALDYTNGEKNLYAYKMEGFDKDWIFSGNRRYVSYTNLDPGKYVFRVKASNSDGVWNEDGVAVEITVLPAWWETVWFRGIAALLLAASVLGAFQWRVRAINAYNRKLEKQVAERTSETQDLYDNAPSGYHSVNEDGVVIKVNQTELNWLGYKREEMIGYPITQFLTSDSQLAYQTWFSTLQANSKQAGIEVNFILKDQSTLPALLTATVLTNDQGKIANSRFTVIDITERKKADEELRESRDNLSFVNAELEKASRQLYEQTIRDPLTGLYNRRFFNELIPHELERANRETKPISFMMVDLDHFKKVNDTYGHEAGDLVLIQVAKLLKDQTRSSDYVFRFGGEEFLVVLPATLPQAAYQYGERWRLLLWRSEIFYNGQKISVTASGGISAYLYDNKPVQDVIAAADQALYQAKKRGRNCIILDELLHIEQTKQLKNLRM